MTSNANSALSWLVVRVRGACASPSAFSRPERDGERDDDGDGLRELLQSADMAGVPGRRRVELHNK